MRELKIAYGNSRKTKFWSNSSITFDALCEKLKTPMRTPESVGEYNAMTRDEKSDIKDNGGFVAGHLKDNRRKRDKVICRSMLVYDIDKATNVFVSNIRARMKHKGCFYSTHSHTPENPRVRMICPTTRDMTPDEHNAVSRYIAEELGLLEMIDPCSFEPHQLMFWPSVCSDGEYLFGILDGEFVDPNIILASHPEWHDCSLLPTTPQESTAKQQPASKQQDPLTKSGIVGRFCRMYSVDDVIAKFLSDIYEPCFGNRYTYKAGESTAGLVTYGNGKFAYSHHATDPAYGKLLNAFDLVRVHKFPDEPEISFRAMATFAESLPDVKALAVKESYENAREDFSEYTEEQPDPLMPEPIHLSDITSPPSKPPELIYKILRKGHKMLIAGPSKAGKSFLLIELAISIAEGIPWLGFRCCQGKVLYVNLEIDPASCIDRFLSIYSRLGVKKRHMDNIIIWNLRGHALPLNRLAPILIDRMKNEKIDAVIVDPIYKVITGDENNASDMGAFCNQFDKICTAMGASAIYCHHHSKGHQGSKKAMDRASGSGVFARDPDAQLDIIELKKPRDTEDEFEALNDTKTAWRMEASLREFPPIKNVNFYFDHPIHTLDTDNKLTGYNPDGSSAANLAMSSKRTTAAQRKKRLDDAFEAAPKDIPVTVADLADLAEVSQETIRRYLKEFNDEYMVKNGVVMERPPLS